MTAAVARVEICYQNALHLRYLTSLGFRLHPMALMWVMAALIGVGIALIIDLDRTQTGLITVSQQPSIRPTAASAPST